MAHFLEHLVFKGGEKYPTYKDVNETAERLGGVLNAYTSHDLVAFHITVRAESAPAGDRPAQRLRRAPAPRRRGARPRARRRDPGDQPRLRPAVDGRRVPDRPGGLRRAPARAHGARARGEPAQLHARGDRGLPRAPLGGRARRRVPRRATSSTCPTRRSCRSASRRFPSLPEPDPYLPAPEFAPQKLVEERDTNQSHLRMIYRPEIAVVRPARTRRARRSTRRCSAARWARACSRRSARSAACATRSTRSTTRSPTCRSCSSARAWSRASASRPTRACARSSTSCASDGPTEEEVAAGARLRRRAARAGVREHQRGRPLRAPTRRIVFGEDIDPDAAIAALDAVTFDEVRRSRPASRTTSRSPAWARTPPTSSERAGARSRRRVDPPARGGASELREPSPAFHAHFSHSRKDPRSAASFRSSECQPTACIVTRTAKLLTKGTDMKAPRESSDTTHADGAALAADDQSPANVSRRTFLATGVAAGVGATLGPLGKSAAAFADRGFGLSEGDAAILRFLAAAEIIETDLWQQYNELARHPGLRGPRRQRQPALHRSRQVLDGDMAQYIHDNTEDELSHFTFINAYLESKGAEPVNLDHVPHPAEQQGDRRTADRTADQPDAADRRHELLDALPQPHQEPRSRRHVPAGGPGSREGQVPGDPAQRRRSRHRTSTSRRSPTRRASTSGSSSRAAPASTRRSPSGSATRRCCASC